jgi:hypothetical protein
VAAHGYPRATGDLDIWIRRSDENAQRVFRALARFRAPLFDLTLNDLKTPDTVFQIGNAPERIDILTSISGVEFDEAWPLRGELAVEGRRYPVIGRAHLLQNKKATGRPKDRADIAWLDQTNAED